MQGLKKPPQKPGRAVAETGSTASAALPSLSPADRARLTVEILRLYAWVYRRLRRTELDRLVATLRAEGGGGPREADRRLDYWQGIRLGKATNRVLGLMPTDSRCLTQSAVLLGLMARRGIDGELVVAVKSAPSFEAHAWVELDGHPLLPSWDDGRILEL